MRFASTWLGERYTRLAVRRRAINRLLNTRNWIDVDRDRSQTLENTAAVTVQERTIGEEVAGRSRRRRWIIEAGQRLGQHVETTVRERVL